MRAIFHPYVLVRNIKYIWTRYTHRIKKLRKRVLIYYNYKSGLRSSSNSEKHLITGDKQRGFLLGYSYLTVYGCIYLLFIFHRSLFLGKYTNKIGSKVQNKYSFCNNNLVWMKSRYRQPLFLIRLLVVARRNQIRRVPRDVDQVELLNSHQFHDQGDPHKHRN